MQARKVELAEIIAEASELGTVHWQPLLAAAAVIVVGYGLLDWVSYEMADASGLAVVYIIVGSAMAIMLQYVVTERLLADRRPLNLGTQRRRYGTLFVALLLSSLAIGFGALLLILPAIYLAGRWLTLVPQLIESNMGATDSMEASWDTSHPSQLAFIFAMLLSVVPSVVAMIMSAVSETQPVWIEALPLLAAINVLTAIASVLGWLIAVAAYRRAVPATTQFDNVFG